jgi:hypothetical protein
MLEIAEPVNVWVFFKGSSIEPWCFFWKNRQIKIDKVNLVHTSKEGSNTFYYFSLSSKGNFYRLKFDTKNLKWFLEAVDESDYSAY